jgi:hypothetical protein
MITYTKRDPNFKQTNIFDESNSMWCSLLDNNEKIILITLPKKVPTAIRRRRCEIYFQRSLLAFL